MNNSSPQPYPRGLKNNNPGNIRQSPVKYLGEVQPSTDTAFKQFQTMAYGYRAMFVLLYTYHKNGFKTLRQMLMRYAPPVENHTELYIKTVSKTARLFENVELSTDDPAEMIPMVSAMSLVENGKEAVEADVKAGWELFVKHKP